MDLVHIEEPLPDFAGKRRLRSTMNGLEGCFMGAGVEVRRWGLPRIRYVMSGPP